MKKKANEVNKSETVINENSKVTLFSKEWFEDCNPYLTFTASVIAIITFIASMLIIKIYIIPYILTSEIIRDYAPEDYLMGASLETPNYVLKTTEIIDIKPTSLPLKLFNSKTFFLPKDSFDFKINPSDKYKYKIDDVNKQIVFNFYESRSEIENIQISFSYKQLRNPTVILLDYSGVVVNTTIDENLILENAENAKITSYRANWIINENETDWLLDKIQNNPDFILVDGNIIRPDINRTKLNKTNVLIYSWDMDFKENEIKPIKILTRTSANYTRYSFNAEYVRKEPATKYEFPFKEGNFEWVRPMIFMKEFPFPNETGYFNGSGFLSFPFPVNKTIYEKFYQDFSKQGRVLE
ncbi:MAG: hypothetical protein FIB07_12650 [Candidatus Methanoperedens sp.]|nr:hypothetical protein [Candidatus Methanoperedens sp.]